MTKRLKTFEQVNEGKRKDDLNHEDLLLINGSGLFWWGSRRSDAEKLEIVRWYQGLPDQDRRFVDVLRNESSDEADSNAAEMAAGEDI